MKIHWQICHILVPEGTFEVTTRLNLADALYKILKVEMHYDRFYVIAVALLGNCRDAFVCE